ncbi:hypothetical protein ABMC88_02805 [Sulfitobacter sp. HNIBRBA2951]
MFKLLKFLTVLCLGAVLGFQLHGMLSKAECSASGGDWNDSICYAQEQSQ